MRPVSVESTTRTMSCARRSRWRSPGRDLLVIPVLVGDAAMPRREHLPRDLAALAECNALRVTDEGYEHEVERLIRTLDHVVNSTTYGAHASAARRPPPSGTAAPRPRISRSDSAAFTSAASVAADQARVEIGEVERGGRGSRRRSHSGLIDRDRLRRNVVMIGPILRRPAKSPTD